MTPLVRIAIGDVTGWPNRLLRSSAIALPGILLTIGISDRLTRVAPVTFDPSTNGQILSRSNPTVIAISLVPPGGGTRTRAGRRLIARVTPV